MIVREQIDRATPRARQQIGDRAHLIRLRLREKAIRSGLDHCIRLPNRYDGTRQHANLDRLRMAVLIHVRGLVRDVEIDVDHLARQRGARSQQRNFLGLPRTAVDHRTAAGPAYQPYGAGFDVA